MSSTRSFMNSDVVWPHSATDVLEAGRALSPTDSHNTNLRGLSVCPRPPPQAASLPSHRPPDLFPLLAITRSPILVAVTLPRPASSSLGPIISPLLKLSPVRVDSPPFEAYCLLHSGPSFRRRIFLSSPFPFLRCALPPALFPSRSINRPQSSILSSPPHAYSWPSSSPSPLPSPISFSVGHPFAIDRYIIFRLILPYQSANVTVCTRAVVTPWGLTDPPSVAPIISEHVRRRKCSSIPRRASPFTQF
ncbi:hypothetical protein C8Q70DRAFT_586365 [Cubamyces menziesii]|nr:hypothetical protein C8Q70DRAFT_586365 [Cubamyces menziesii]